MTRFAGLKDDLPPGRSATAKATEPSPTSVGGASAETNGKRRPAREGKKGILGHFSPELSRALNIMAIEEGSTCIRLGTALFGSRQSPAGESTTA